MSSEDQKYDPEAEQRKRALRWVAWQKDVDPEPASALAVQVGGDHYRTLKIQPVEYITANKLGFLEGCIVKRITRWRAKNGVEDLLKIKHEVDLLIELETKNAG